MGLCGLAQDSDGRRGHPLKNALHIPPHLANILSDVANILPNFANFGAQPLIKALNIGSDLHVGPFQVRNSLLDLPEPPCRPSNGADQSKHQTNQWPFHVYPSDRSRSAAALQPIYVPQTFYGPRPGLLSARGFGSRGRPFRASCRLCRVHLVEQRHDSRRRTRCQQRHRHQAPNQDHAAETASLWRSRPASP